MSGYDTMPRQTARQNETDEQNKPALRREKTAMARQAQGETLLGIDVGTTNTKVGVCDQDGRLLALESLPSPLRPDPEGHMIYDPLLLWDQLEPLLAKLIGDCQPRAIGITGMSEPGVLIDVEQGEPVSGMLPWSDRRSACFSDISERMREEQSRFLATGLHNSYKYSVYKALTELKQNPALARRDLLFLQAPSYIAWRLTGQFAVDPTLALRTYAYDLRSDTFDKAFLNTLGLSKTLFAPVKPSGRPAGKLTETLAARFGAREPMDVAVCGHDHMCAALAAGAAGENDCFLSLGTTGVVLGSFARRALTPQDFATGYSYGLHVVPDRMTWLGAIQAAGSAVDWCARLTGLEGDYPALDQMLHSRYTRGVGEILFLPYLSGSGAPHLDGNARGGFLGLKLAHDRSDLAFSVLEGLAYEIRLILSHAPFSRPPACIRAVGGGTRGRVLLQVLADVTGCTVIVSDCEQAALTGAALLAAGRACFPAPGERESFTPDAARAAVYTQRYERWYLPAQQLVRSFSKETKEGAKL